MMKINSLVNDLSEWIIMSLKRKRDQVHSRHPQPGANPEQPSSEAVITALNSLLSNEMLDLLIE
jgi:hypothetical protein